MRKMVAGLSVSLDGVTDSARDWMMTGPETDQLINEGIARSDTILLGRKTFVEFEQIWPPMGDAFPMASFLNRTPKIVVSDTLTSTSWADTTIVRGAQAADFLKDLKEQPGGEIKIPGSPSLVRWLLSVGLLDELGLLLHPLVVGRGAHLFDDVAERFPLALKSSSTFSNGVLSLTYGPA